MMQSTHCRLRTDRSMTFCQAFAERYKGKSVQSCISLRAFLLFFLSSAFTANDSMGIKGLMLEPRCCWNVRLGRVRGPQGSCGLPHTQHPCSTNRKNKQRRGNSYANSRQQVHEQIFQYKNRENRFLRLAVYTTSLLNNTKNKEHGNLYANPRQRLHELTASKKSMFSLKI